LITKSFVNFFNKNLHLQFILSYFRNDLNFNSLKKMRKLFAISFVAVMLTLASCAGKENKAEGTDSTAAPVVEQPVDTAAVADTAAAQ
jgi:hypothetical protein